MLIGVPKEIKNHEYRVGLTPSGVRELVAAGHKVMVQTQAGLAIGFGIGYGLDRLLGTMPLFLVLFIFAGLAAGVKTMLRSAKEVEMRRAAKVAEKEDDGRGD